MVDEGCLPLNVAAHLKATSGINASGEPPDKTIDNDIEPSVDAEEQDIEIDVSQAHVLTFCLRCLRVVTGVLECQQLPDWLTGS